MQRICLVGTALRLNVQHVLASAVSG
jgi:hypothetical protein